MVDEASVKQKMNSAIVDYFRKDGHTYSRFEEEFDNPKLFFVNFNHYRISVSRDLEKDSMLHMVFDDVTNNIEKVGCVRRIVSNTIGTSDSQFYFSFKYYVVKTALDYICTSLTEEGFSEDEISNSIANYIKNGDINSIPENNDCRMIASNVGNDNLGNLLSSAIISKDGYKIVRPSVKTYYKSIFDKKNN